MSVSLVANIIGTFISYLNVSLIYGIVTKSKFKISIKLLILMIVMAILNTTVIIQLPIGFKTVFNFICLTLFNKIIYNNKIKDELYYIIIIWAVGILLDMLFMALFPVLLEKVVIMFPNVGIALISLILQLIQLLIFKIKFMGVFINKFKNKIDMINNIVWLFMLSIFLIVLFSVLAFINLRHFNNTIIIILISLIVISIVGFFIKIISDEKMYKLAIENLMNNNRYYLELNKKDSIFRHNIIHHLNSIKTISNKKTCSLIDDLIAESHINNMQSKDIELLPNGINGLICSYIYGKGHDKLNVAVNNYLESDLFDVLTPRKYNKLCETLGVCLDNAVTASRKSKEKVMQIVLLEDKESIYVKIINTFSTSIEIEKLGTYNYTTNDKGHGIGLSSILKRRDINVKTSIINNLFENQIMIKKKKDNK